MKEFVFIFELKKAESIIFQTKKTVFYQETLKNIVEIRLNMKKWNTYPP